MNWNIKMSKKTNIQNLQGAKNVLYGANADVWSLLFNLTCENIAGELSNEVDMYLRMCMARLSESMSHVDELDIE
jgi:hypothetical protein